MIRYNTEIIPRVVDYVINRGTDPRGFTPVKGVMTEEPASIREKRPLMDPFKLSYLQKMITLCKDNNVPLFFISSPKYGAKSSDILQPAKAIAQKNHIQYWDYYSVPIFNSHKEWFNEPMHLNEVGAREYSKLLVKLIAENLPDIPAHSGI
jgi:hypothetical protein